MERGCRGYGNAVLPQIPPVPAVTRVVCKGAKQSCRTKDREGITLAGRGRVLMEFKSKRGGELCPALETQGPLSVRRCVSRTSRPRV